MSWELVRSVTFVSAGYDLRVIFKMIKKSGKSLILLETIGTHDEVY